MTDSAFIRTHFVTAREAFWLGGSMNGKCEDRAVSRLTGNFNPTTVGVGNRPANRQTHSRTGNVARTFS